MKHLRAVARVRFVRQTSFISRWLLNLNFNRGALGCRAFQEDPFDPDFLNRKPDAKSGFRVPEDWSANLRQEFEATPDEWNDTLKKNED